MGKRIKKLVASGVARATHRRLRDAGGLGKHMAVQAKPRPATSVKFSPPKKSRGMRPRLKKQPDDVIGLSPTGTLEQGIIDAFTAATRFLVERTDAARKRRVSMAQQGNPLAGRKRDLSIDGPTQRRLAKSGYGATKVEVNPNVRTSRIKSAIEICTNHLTDEEKATKDRFVEDFEAACNVSTISRIYEGAPGGGGGARAGHIAENQRLAHARFNFLVRTLDRRFRIVAEQMVLELVNEKLGRPMTLEEFAEMASKYRDKASRRAFSVGAVKGTLWRLSEAYLAWDGHRQRVEQEMRLRGRSRRQDAPLVDQPEGF